MIQSLTVYTAELDDEHLAVEEILSQLERLNGYHKNTIGIVACHYEFVHSGVFKAVCDALPFDVIGTTTSTQANPDETDLFLLTLMVMTSDDVAFDKVITESLLTEPEQAITDSYKVACRSENPALILTFAPYILQNCGDSYVNELTKTAGGVPCFGTIAVDDTLDFSNCFMLANGEYFHDKMAMVLIYGDIHPKFYIASISESRIFGKSADVTKSAGPVLMEVNNRPVIEYFTDLGIAEASAIQYAMASLPLLLDYNDGSPKVSKILVMLNEEKHAICAGAMPEGSTLYMTKADKDDVLVTTSEAVDLILKDIDDASVLLIYSCISRGMALGSEQLKEMELTQEKVGNKIPFIMASSGGEICPTLISEEKAINRFHNNAFVACLF